MFQNREKDFQHPWIPILSLFCAPLLKKTGCLKNRTSPPNDARFRRAEFTFCNWRRELLTRRALGTRLLVFAHFHWTRRDRKRPSVIGLISFGVRILQNMHHRCNYKSIFGIVMWGKDKPYRIKTNRTWPCAPTLWSDSENWHTL